MDQAKIGKFIGELRKEKKLKQAELAEKLGVTSKTVSRWETGKYMPDLSLFTDISQILGVTINELLQGERLIKKKKQFKYRNRDKIRNRRRTISQII